MRIRFIFYLDVDLHANLAEDPECLFKREVLGPREWPAFMFFPFAKRLPLASTGFDLSFPPAFKAESHAVERGGSPPVSHLAQQLIPRHRTLGGAQPGGCGHPGTSTS